MACQYQVNMTDRMSDSIRERQYGQNCHHSSQLSQKFTMIDNFHKDSYLLIIVTIVNNCHNYWLFSKLLRMSQLPFIKICHSCQNWSKFLLLITINCNCIGQNCHNWSKLSQLVIIVKFDLVTFITTVCCLTIFRQI